LQQFVAEQEIADESVARSAVLLVLSAR